MAKRGVLSKEEKDYITQNLDAEIKDIAQHLDRTEATVQKFIDASKEQSSQDDLGDQKTGDLMSRNETYGSVSMTQGASIAGDNNRETPQPPKTPARQHGSIHVIKDK